jgi:hypothetical protein
MVSKVAGHRSQVRGQRIRVAGHAVWVILFFMFFSVPQCDAYTVSSDELIEKAKDLDGREVTYRGEAVTDILGKGGHSWINVNDGDNAIGIWCGTESLREVRFVGNYKHRGDIVEVEGIFNRACPEHGGELDIHAYKVWVVKRGTLVEEGLDSKIIYLTLIFFFLTLFIIGRYRRRTGLTT